MSGNFISLAQAKAMTDRFKANQDSVLIPELRNQGILYISETLDREWFDYLLNEEGATGLRFYNGMDEELKTRLIAVAVDKDGNALLPAAGSTTVAAGGNQIAEEGQRCPTNCNGSGL
jgi:hypothetical protein